MKSPFTGKEMKKVYEKRTWDFRGEKYDYVHASWLCVDTGESFTTDETDNVSYIQVTNQYRVRYGIPFTDEIIAVREFYGLSAAKMSLILGLGTNQWRHYEAGEVPNVSNGRMIRSIMNPVVFLDYVNSAKNILGEKEFAKLRDKMSVLIDQSSKDEWEEYGLARVFQCARSAENGFAPLSLIRLRNMLLYILSRCGEVFCTKMNKLLFYTDFLAYRRLGMAISGLSYKAIEYGPVPERWDRVYSQFDDILQEPRSYGEKEGCVLLSDASADETVFTAAELRVLNDVCERFCNSTSTDMTRISHEECLWLDNVEGHRIIPFESAFLLKAI